MPPERLRVPGGLMQPLFRGAGSCPPLMQHAPVREDMSSPPERFFELLIAQKHMV